MFGTHSSQFGVLPVKTTPTQFEELDPSSHSIFRHTWADHANLIAVQYAGTGALKTDYTRTGKVLSKMKLGFSSNCQRIIAA